MTRTTPDTRQMDMLDHQSSDARILAEAASWAGFDLQLCYAMKKAAAECGIDRHEIAFRMSRLIDDGEISKHMLDAYISPAKDTHNISLKRFCAFVHATGAHWLLPFIAKDMGVTVTVGSSEGMLELAKAARKREALQRQINAIDLEIGRLARTTAPEDAA